MHLRFKRHRWYPKVLKNRDPLVFSAGWRRFQSIPVFSQEDNNQRQRMLKYSPEHMHCRATIFGPLSPSQAGMVAIQNLSGSLASWRISATASVMEVDAKFDIVKKLKLVGYPYKVERHTAFVRDMCTSQVLLLNHSVLRVSGGSEHAGACRTQGLTP
jgi:ribosome biogenesis protein BMS1